MVMLEREANSQKLVSAKCPGFFFVSIKVRTMIVMRRKEYFTTLRNFGDLIWWIVKIADIGGVLFWQIAYYYFALKYNFRSK